MFDRFDNVPEGYIPDNRFRYLEDDTQDSIIIGGSCTHIFTLPFLYSEYAADASLIYRQGLNVIVTIPADRFVINETSTGHCNKTTITVLLTPEETGLFKITSLDTWVQMKLITKEDNKTEYSKRSKIIVKAPMDSSIDVLAEDSNAEQEVVNN